MDRFTTLTMLRNSLKHTQHTTILFYVYEKKKEREELNIKIRIFAAEVGYHEIRNYC